MLVVTTVSAVAPVAVTQAKVAGIFVAVPGVVSSCSADAWNGFYGGLGEEDLHCCGFLVNLVHHTNTHWTSRPMILLVAICCQMMPHKSNEKVAKNAGDLQLLCTSNVVGRRW